MKIAAFLLITLLAGVIAIPEAKAEIKANRALFLSGSHTLQGVIYKPEGRGPFPAVVFSQASLSGKKDTTEPFVALAKLFTSRGYVFFVPGRHAVVVDERINKTDRLLTTFEQHAADLSAAVTWLKAQVYVDEKRIAIMGDMAGAVTALMTTGSEIGVSGMILFSAGTQTLQENKKARERLIHVAQTTQIPIFLIQVENDRNLLPRELLGRELEKKPGANRVKVFASYGGSITEAQSFCVEGSAVWQKDVFSFLKQVGG